MSNRRKPTFELEFDTRDADQRQAAKWLLAQPDPAEAVTRLIKSFNTARLKLQQWQDTALQLAGEVRDLQAQLTGQPDPRAEETEDNESARRLDSIFG